MEPCIIMRSHNDMPCIAQTLDMLSRQNCPHQVIALDNASTDGTLQWIRQHTDKVINVPAGTYIPGRVLNLGMETSKGEFVVLVAKQDFVL